MSGREYAERVWRALHEIRKANIDTSAFVVNVAPDVWADLRVENPFNIMTMRFPATEPTTFGLATRENPDLEPGSIVLRYEVTA